jgi:phenylpropionate dioxygenase-like ring-hydroxylating dioxygenase large terminal subunit
VILEQLERNARRPFEEALTLPPGAYTSEELVELERARIFRSEWACVGREDQLSSPGDYLSFDVGGEPGFTIRGRDGALRSFANVCLHRMTQLLEGSGRCLRIVCPYHAWTYDTEGRLTGAPFMNKTPGFELRKQGLPPLRTEVFAGFVYVCLDPKAEAVSARLQRFSELFGDFHLEDYQTLDIRDEVWSTNWKCLAENFMESYHVFKVHATSFEPSTPTKTTECPPGEPTFNYHLMGAAPEAALRMAPKSNTSLRGAWRVTTVIVCIYPSHLISFGPRTYWSLSLQPLQSDRVAIRAHFGASPHAIAEAGSPQHLWNENLRDLYDQAISEDRAIVEAIRRGAASSRAGRNRLCHMERTLWEFGSYLSRRLNGTS